ncbi:hypothetical protein Tco_0628511 [Tanacetum coccineum]|uniref:Uncharacterized protein n=1 Tax=Tanacetum coccineum TaxID=301880 RepID=A0ABQ4WQI9_9ASTR
MANFLASMDVGYGTNSLLKQWKESYEDEEYDYDPYDDDMYEGQDIPGKIQDICDNLDIKVRGRKKKLVFCFLLYLSLFVHILKEVVLPINGDLVKPSSIETLPTYRLMVIYTLVVYLSNYPKESGRYLLNYLGSGSRFDTAYPRIGYGVLGIS